MKTFLIVGFVVLVAALLGAGSANAKQPPTVYSAYPGDVQNFFEDNFSDVRMARCRGVGAPVIRHAHRLTYRVLFCRLEGTKAGKFGCLTFRPGKFPKYTLKVATCPVKQTDPYWQAA